MLTNKSMTVLIACLFVLVPLLAGADTWDDRFHPTGIDGVARANLTVGDDLIVGGNFAAAGVVAVKNIARWDGSAWHALGSGFDADVRDLVLFDGDVYACGQFTHAGDLEVNHVARWDGMQWLGVGDGLPVSVSAMAVYAGELWCAGWRFDGAEWVEIVPTDSYVRDLIVHENRLVFGGDFTTAGGVPAAHVAAWDGSTVVELSGHARDVSDLEVVDADLFALARDVYGEDDPVRVWTGTDWSVVGNLPVDYVSDYLSLINHGGQLRMMKVVSLAIPPVWWTDVGTWDGLSWTWLEQTFDQAGAVHCFEHDDDLLLSGRFTRLGGTIANGIGRLTDAGPVALGPAGLGFGGSPSWTVADICGTPEGVAAGGTFYSVGPVVTTSAALWDGAAWQPRDGLGRHITCLVWHDGQLHAFYWAGDVVDNNYMVWDGNEWQPTGQSDGDGNPHDALSYDGRLLTARSEINDWSDPLNPMLFADFDGGDLWSLLDWNGALVVGGDFTHAETVPANSVAMLDDGVWQEVAGGLDGSVSALAVHEGSLVAGGALGFGGGGPDNDVAMVVGGTWQPLGETIDGVVEALVSYGGFLYAGGQFAVDGVNDANFARWDGATWSVVGGGVNGQIHDFVVFDDKLYLSGEFSVVGESPSARFAVWDGTTILQAPGPPSPSVYLSAAAPNPFNPATTVQFSLAQGAHVRLDVFDVRGHRVRTLVDHWTAAGSHAATWNGRDGAGRPMSAGLYMLRLQAAGEVRTTKVALVE